MTQLPLRSISRLRYSQRSLRFLSIAGFLLVSLSSAHSAWAQAAGWTQLSNTQLQSVCPANTQQYAFSDNCKAVVYAWSGAVADTTNNRLIVWGGGHVDYYGNEVYALNLGNKTLTRLNNPSPVASPGSDAEVLSDGAPNSRHTYDGLAYIAYANRMFAFSGSLASSNGNASSYTWTLDLSTLKWQQMTPVHGAQPVPGFGVVADYDPVTRNVFLHDIHNFYQYNYDTNTYTALTGNSSNTYVIDYHDTAVVDPSRRLFVIMGNGDFKAISIASGSNYALQDWSAASSGCSGLFSAASPGLAYDSALNRIVGWPGGNTVYILNPDTKSCTTMTFSGGPGAEQGNGTFGRFRYFPSLDAFAVVNDAQQSAYLLKLSGSSSPSGPVISNVNTTSITTTGATVTWTTDVGATSQVEYGASTSYGSSTTLNSTLVTGHSVSLSGLTAGTLYHFRVHSKNSSGVESISGDFTFTTSSTTPPTPPPSGTTHLDFKYSSSQALKTAGWSYIATTASGAQRNTEQSGSLAVSYDQTAHPGTIRIPVGSGEIWQNSNNSQNMLVYTLPTNWSSERVDVAAFNPVARDQETGLLAYQDDDNYVIVNRIFGFNGSVVEMFSEQGQVTTMQAKVPIQNSGNLILRLDRSSTTYTGFFSTDGGKTWTTVASLTNPLRTANLALQVGGNVAGTLPTSSIAWVEYIGTAATATISNVAVGAIGPNGATVTWNTSTPASSQVEYGTTTAYGSVTPLDSTAVTNHSVLLSNLNPGTLYHFRVRSKDPNSGTEAISGDGTFTTQGTRDTTPPTVSVTSPSNGASVSGAINLTANASDNVGVAGVQFMIDGAAMGAAQSSAPYTVSWNSSSIANGSHTITAKAWDAANNTATSQAITVTVSNSGTPTGSGFQARCQSPGVIRCWDFEDQNSTAAHLMPPFGSTTLQGQIVHDVVADGSGSLRFTVPAQSGADTSGSFSLNFSDDLTKQFGEGQEFYLQMRVRYSDAMITTNFAGSNGFKTLDVGEGDRPGTIAYSCTTLETVLQDIQQNGYPRAYHSCGTYQELQVQIPNTFEFLDQNADGCPHYGNQGFPQTEPPCFKYKANEWITIQEHIKVGHWGQDDSTIEYWAADQGKTSRLMISLADYKLLNDNPTQAKFGKVWLTPYQTGKDDTQINPVGYVWYDSLIISTKRIPDPDVNTPNAPDLLRAKPGTNTGTIQLTWRDNAGGTAQGFKIGRCSGLANSCMASPSEFVTVATVSPTTTSFVDSGLTAGQTYTYRVNAYNASGDSAYSGGACWAGTSTCYSQSPPK